MNANYIPVDDISNRTACDLLEKALTKSPEALFNKLKGVPGMEQFADKFKPAKTVKEEEVGEEKKQTLQEEEVIKSEL